MAEIIDARITPEENEVNNLLARACNAFEKLPVIHHQDFPEFVAAIHAAQNIILARVGLRSLQIYRPENSDDRLRPTPENIGIIEKTLVQTDVGHDMAGNTVLMHMYSDESFELQVVQSSPYGTVIIPLLQDPSDIVWGWSMTIKDGVSHFSMFDK